jgi:ribosomal protein S18 acetylase RimI-like enzyme
MTRTLRPVDVEDVVALAVRAWAPVFGSMERTMGPRVFRRVYPDWRASHAAAVRAECLDPGVDVWVATDPRAPDAPPSPSTPPLGFVAVRMTTEDAAQVGEIEMIAVDPARQGEGIGDALMTRALAEISVRGVDLAVIGTGGDPGHAAARALYERHGFEPFPLVRYYREI